MKIRSIPISHDPDEIRRGQILHDFPDVLKIVRTYNDKPYNRQSIATRPVLSIQKFLHRLSGALTAITDRVRRRSRGGTLRVYCTATPARGNAVSDSFGSEVQQFAKSLFVSELMLSTPGSLSLSLPRVNSPTKVAHN